MYQLALRVIARRAAFDEPGVLVRSVVRDEVEQNLRSAAVRRGKQAASNWPSTWLRKLVYVVPISLRYPRSEGTTNLRRPRESGDPEPAPLLSPGAGSGMNRGRPIGA